MIHVTRAIVQKKLELVNAKQILQLLIVTGVTLVTTHTQSVKNVIVSSMVLEDLSVKPAEASVNANPHMEAVSVKNVTYNILDFQTVQVVIFKNSFLVYACFIKYVYISFYLLFQTACDCNSIGSQSPVCHSESGKCTCKSNFGGRQCDQCADGYHSYPDCQCMYLLLQVLKVHLVPFVLLIP